jgi:DNA-binding NarL/FixJ family response regulator
MIRVLIADDHAVVRAGLREVLRTAGISVVGEAADGTAAVAAVATCTPDVVLMDLSMPGLDGVQATRRIRTLHPDVPVVVLTSFIDRDRIVDALDAGAVGYLLKGDEPEELVRGIHAAARGESPIAPKAATVLLSSRAGRTGATDLTGRERDVLALVAEGLPNKLIARRLAISEKTVKAHLTSAFHRIGVTDRTQAALWVQRNSLN